MEKDKSGKINIYKDFLRETAKNALMGTSTVRNWRLKRPRAGSYFTGSDAELERYAFSGLNFLRKYVGDVRGKSVCEIGAGDYLTSGLAILAAGASRYAVIDRFPGDYEGETAKKWYKGIEENWTRTYPEIEWAKDLKAEDFPEKYSEKLELIKEGVETADTKSKFDIVCSFQVGEHISDINAFAEMHNRILKKNGGVALHRIDYGPHDVWSYYKDPLTFLRFSDATWNLTGSNRGAPNRFRHHEFMAAFERANLSVEVLHTELFDEKAIEFDLLYKKFHTMSRESMLIGTGIYLLRLK